MAWKKIGSNQSNNKYIKYEKGKIIEGIITKIEAHPSPFTEGAVLYDYCLTTSEGEQILSSGAKTLQDAFAEIPMGTRVQITCAVSKKGYKCYSVAQEVNE